MTVKNYENQMEILLENSNFIKIWMFFNSPIVSLKGIWDTLGYILVKGDNNYRMESHHVNSVN